MAISTLGNKLSGSPTLREFYTYWQHYVKPTTPLQVLQAGFIESLGLWLQGPVSSYLYLGVYAVDAAGVPTSMLARTARLSYPSIQNAAGYNMEGPLDWVNVVAAPGSLPKTETTPARLYLPANTTVALAWLAYPPTSGPDMYFGSTDADGNKTAYIRHHALTYALQSPFAHTDVLLTYAPGIYATFNVPDVPAAALTTPTASASIVDDTPVLSGTFSSATTFDTFAAYQVEVWLNAGTVPLRDSGVRATTPTEQATKAWLYTYDGPDLAGGQTYKWRARVQATGGGWSPYTVFRTFSIPLEGGVDLATGAVPAAGSKIDRPDLMTWAARWYHTAGEAMNAVRIVITNADGSPFRESAAIAKAVTGTIPGSPPGTLFTVSQAEAAAAGVGGDTLLPGRTYHAYMQGRSAVSGAFSALAGPLIFRTNALAGVPIPLSPPDGVFLSARPTVIVQGYDPDTDDTPGSDTIWQFEVRRVATSTSVIVNADSYVLGATPDLNEARLTLGPAQVPGFGVYQWRARSVEAAAGPAGTSAWTAWRTFTYNAGPTVTITEPTASEQVQVSDLRVEWTNSEPQKLYQVQVFRRDDNVRVYVTSVFASDRLYHDIPTGALPPGVSYYVRVSAWNTSNIQGTSLDRGFTVVAGAVVPLKNVSVVVQQIPSDVEPTTPAILWGRSGLPESRFIGYAVRRYVTAEGILSAVPVALVSDLAQLGVRDYHAPPGVGLTYLVSQQGVNDAGATTESEAVVVTAQVNLTTPVIVGIDNPPTLRFPIHWQQDGPPSEKAKPRRAVYQTWGAGGKPTIAKAPGVQETRAARCTLLTDSYGSAQAKRLRVKALIASGTLVSYRNGRERLWMDIADSDISPGDSPGSYDVTLSLEETAYQESTG